MHETLFSDAGGYHGLAVEILYHHTFGSERPELSAIRTLGYPLFIAIIYAVFGEIPGMVLLIQILLDAVLIVFLYKFVKENLGEKAAFWASLLYSIDPIVIFFTVQLWSDYLFMFLLFFSVLFFWDGYKKQELSKFIYSSIFLATAVYVRPVGMYLIWVYTILLVFWTAGNIKKKFIFSGTYLAIFWILLFPWMARNVHVHHHFFFSTSGDYNLFKLYASQVESMATGESPQKWSETIERQVAEQFGKITRDNVVEYHAELKKIAIHTFIHYPVAFVKSYIYGIVKLLFTPKRDVFEMITGKLDQKPVLGTEKIKREGIRGFLEALPSYKTSSIIFIIYSLLWYLFCYVLAILGAIVLWNTHPKLLLFLGIPIIYFIVISAQAGIARFKLPMILFYLQFSGIMSNLFSRGNRV